jgi:hypothetical protein
MPLPASAAGEHDQHEQLAQHVGPDDLIVLFVLIDLIINIVGVGVSARVGPGAPPHPEHPWADRCMGF